MNIEGGDTGSAMNGKAARPGEAAGRKPETGGRKPSGKRSSAEKLMKAVIDLVSERGYHAVSTKEIAAEAGVNEVTLFRHFGSKQQLLEQAFHRYHYAEEMTKLFQEHIAGDLQTDLPMLARKYHELMNRNRKIFLIAQKEMQVMKQFQEKANKHPRVLKELLTEYFDRMQAEGKMIRTNSELQALTFMWMNHGAFMSLLHGGHEPILDSSRLDDYIRESVATFIRGVSP